MPVLQLARVTAATVTPNFPYRCNLRFALLCSCQSAFTTITLNVPTTVRRCLCAVMCGCFGRDLRGGGALLWFRGFLCLPCGLICWRVSLRGAVSLPRNLLDLHLRLRHDVLIGTPRCKEVIRGRNAEDTASSIRSFWQMLGASVPPSDCREQAKMTRLGIQLPMFC